MAMFSKAFSLSMAQGRVAKEHDDRTYTPKNADKRLEKFNRTVKRCETDYETAFNDYFKEVIDEYNAKQKRSDRKIQNYYREIQDSARKEHAIYEYVIQIGNREDNGVTDSTFDVKEWKKNKAEYDIMAHINQSQSRKDMTNALDRVADKLQEKYPAFHFWTIERHSDEPDGTDHYHIAFTPIGTGFKNGLPIRCSLTQALKSMGFQTKGGDLGIMQWQNDVKQMMEEEMLQLGYEREYKNNSEKHLSVDQYKLAKENEALLIENEELTHEKNELNATVSDLKAQLDDLKEQVENYPLKLKEALNGLLNVSEEYKNAIQDDSRESFMKTIKYSNGSSVEDAYQDYIREQQQKLEEQQRQAQLLAEQQMRQAEQQRQAELLHRSKLQEVLCVLKEVLDKKQLEEQQKQEQLLAEQQAQLLEEQQRLQAEKQAEEQRLLLEQKQKELKKRRNAFSDLLKEDARLHDREYGE